MQISNITAANSTSTKAALEPSGQLPSTTNPKTTSAGDTASTNSNGQKLLAVVTGFDRNSATIKTLVDAKILQLQTSQQLSKGQLILLETNTQRGKSELILQTNQRQVTDQILRLLLPQTGNLKVLTQNALASLSTANQKPIVATNSSTTFPTTSNAAQTSSSTLLASTFASTGGTQVSTNVMPSSQQTIESSVTRNLGNLLQQMIGANTSKTGIDHRAVSTPVEANLLRATNQNSQQLGNVAELLKALPATSQLLEPAAAGQLLQPGQNNPLLKLLLPLLKTQLSQAPLNAEQKLSRDSQITATTQLVARLLLGLMGNASATSEGDISRNEWVSRFEQSIDSLQAELSMVREQVKEKSPDDSDDDLAAQEKIRQWRVRLTFDFDELGSITAFILLSNDRKMEIQFWSEKESTQALITEHRKRFSQQLDNAVSNFGIETVEVAVFDGTPPESKQNITSHLINETA